MIARLEVLKLNYLRWQSWQSRYVAGIKGADATAKVGAASGDKADKAINLDSGGEQKKVRGPVEERKNQ